MVHVGQGIDDTIDKDNLEDRTTPPLYDNQGNPYPRVCKDGEIVINPSEGSLEPLWNARSFYSSREIDIHRRAKSEFEAQFSGPLMRERIKRNVRNANNTEFNDFLLHIAFRVHKATREFCDEPGCGEDPHPSYCEGSTGFTASTFKQFNGNCGTTYIDEQELGGWVLLTTKVTRESSALRADIAKELELNMGASSKTGFSEVAQTLSEYSADLGPIYMNSVGDMKPQNLEEVNPGSGVYEVTISDLGDYKEEMDYRFENEFDGEELHKDVYGVVLDISQESYSAPQFKQCGLSDNPEDLRAYTCVTENFTVASKLRNSTGEIDQLLKAISDYLNNAEDYDWNNNKQQTQADLQALQTDLQECKDVSNGVPSKHSRCKYAVNQGSRSNFCDRCKIGEKCSAGSLVDRYEGLTDGVNLERIPGEHTTYEQIRTGTSSHSADAEARSICVLQKVNGAFADRLDVMKVSHDGAWKDWTLEVADTGPKDIYRMSSRMACADEGEFTDPSNSNSNFYIGFLEYTPNWISSGNTYSTRLTNYEDHAAAVNYYSGTSNGLGEYVRINEKEIIKNEGTEDQKERPIDELIVGNAAKSRYDNGIKGGAIRFGFYNSDRPGGVEKDRKSVDSNGYQKAFLANVDEALCYLTKVSGEFDGAGEHASVVQDGYSWKLRTGAVCQKRIPRKRNKKDCDRKEIQAQARCYYYDH